MNRSSSRISSGAELLLLRLVLVARVGLELLDQRLAREICAEVLAQLLRRDLRLVERGDIAFVSASRSHSSLVLALR